MELSPTDIRNHQFSSQMRGYDKTEVDTFREQIAQALEHARQEHMRVTMELESTKLQLSGLKQFEDTIKGAAIDARRNADATIATARKEAELILQKTKGEVETLIATRRQRIADVESQLEKLELVRKAFLQKIRAMIGSHMELVEAVAGAEQSARQAQQAQQPKPVQPHDDLEITSSSEVQRAHRETIATPPSPSTPLHMEEANAPSHIVPANEPQDPVAASLQKVIHDDEPMQGSVDPELAAALEKYQHRQQQGSHTETPVGHVDEIIDPTGDALDAPLGMVGNNQETVRQEQPVAAGVATGSGAAIPADMLAKELDEVVAKFAEEMDKAAKA
jgi:cell division initiation protein